MENLSNLFQKHIDLCNEIFPKSTETSCLHHTVEEICEVWKETDYAKKPEEYVDAIMCLVHGFNKAGITVEEFAQAFAAKIEKNSNREWNLNDDGSYSHQKS